MIKEAPKGWDLVNFDSFFTVLPSKKYQVQKQDYLEKGLVPVVDQGQKLIIGYTDDESKKFNKNNVIIFGDHTRIVKYIDFDFAVGADGTQILETKDGINLKFGYYQLLNKKIPDTGYNRHFKYVKAEKYVIPPTLAEQQEIVQVLDTMSDIIQLREECISHAQDLIPALFREMFGKIERNTRLNSIISLEYGKALKAENRNSEGEYPVYGSNGIVGYHDSYIVEGQTIIVGRKGSCGKLNLTQKSCFPIDTCFYIKQKTPVNWYYLFYALQELNIENMLKDAVIPGINRNDYLRNSIRLASTSEQEQFAEKVREINSYIEEQQEELENAKQMFQSLLHHAFTGELTKHKYGEINE